MLWKGRVSLLRVSLAKTVGKTIGISSSHTHAHIVAALCGIADLCDEDEDDDDDTKDADDLCRGSNLRQVHKDIVAEWFVGKEREMAKNLQLLHYPFGFKN